MAAGFSCCIQSSGIVVVDCAPCCPGADSSVGHGAFLQACICGITFFPPKGPSDPCGFTWCHFPTMWFWWPTGVVSLSDLGFVVQPWFGVRPVRFHCPTLCCHCPTLCGDTTQGLTATPHRVGQQPHTGVGQLTGPSDPVVSLSGPVVKCHCCSLSARCTVVRMVAAFVSSRWRDFAFARRLAV